MTNRVLIVEDEPEMARLLQSTCRDIGLESDASDNGKDGLEKALTGRYGLVILDVSLPGMDGFSVCTSIRSRLENVRILMVTSRNEELDKVLGLELGADDYITKPFSIREFMARVKAIVRRMPAVDEGDSNQAQADVVTEGRLTIDLRKRTVKIGNTEVKFTAIEFDILAYLAQHREAVITRDELMKGIWGYTASQFDPTITAHISRIRSKLEADPSWPRYLHTVHGVGYSFHEESE